MNSFERINNILHHRPVDRIGIFEHFWPGTLEAWSGHLNGAEDLEALFDFDIVNTWVFNYMADLDFVPQVVSETEDTITKLDGNGATLKLHKHHDTTPEHVAFSVTDRDVWESKIKPFLKVEDRRINFESYRKLRKRAKDNEKFLMCSSVNVFECMHPVCGHEEMLVGMALDPDWIADMVDTYSDLIIGLMKRLFEKEGEPDGIMFYEDMGYKGTPFMSPAMYRDLIYPGHKKTFDFAHSLGKQVTMHSCGFVEPLLPDLIDAGLNCLQAMEVKAGMDLVRIYQNHGDKLALFGGMDVRTILSGDKAQIDAELERKLPVVKQGSYILQSDHSLPPDTDIELYRYFLKKGLEMGRY